MGKARQMPKGRSLLYVNDCPRLLTGFALQNCKSNFDGSSAFGNKRNSKKLINFLRPLRFVDSLKILILVFVFLPCILLFSGCSSPFYSLEVLPLAQSSITKMRMVKSDSFPVELPLEDRNTMLNLFENLQLNEEINPSEQSYQYVIEIYYKNGLLTRIDYIYLTEEFIYKKVGFKTIEKNTEIKNATEEIYVRLQQKLLTGL